MLLAWLDIDGFLKKSETDYEYGLSMFIVHLYDLSAPLP